MNVNLSSDAVSWGGSIAYPHLSPLEEGTDGSRLRMDWKAAV